MDSLAAALHARRVDSLGRRAHPPARGALFARAVRRPRSSTSWTTRCAHRSGSDGKAPQPPAGRVPRRHRRGARHDGVLHRLPAALRDRPDRDHARPSAGRAVRQRAAVRGADRAARLLLPGPLPAAARPLAHRRLLQRAGRQHLRGGARRGRDALLPGVLRDRRAARRRRLRSLADGVGHLPGPQHRARLPVAQVHSRSARAALARGHRPAQDPDRRRRRPRPRRRGPHPRTPRARLPDRRLRRRQGRRRSSRLSRPAAARLARRRRRDRQQRADRRPVRRAAARRAHEAARPGRVDQPRGRRRQGGARPAAVHRAARAPRRSRRRAGDQPERRAAAGPQLVHQARARRDDLGRRAGRSWRCPGC